MGFFENVRNLGKGVKKQEDLGSFQSLKCKLN